MGHPVVVLSYDYWGRRFSHDPSVIGKKILVNNYPMTVVGVSAAGFSGLDPARSPQIRVPDADEGRRSCRSGAGCTWTIRERAGFRCSRG